MRPDLEFLFAADGPFASVYLDSPSNEPQAGQQLALRWKNARRVLADEGADDETLAAMDAAIGVDTEAVATGPQPAREAQNRPSSTAVDDAADHTAGEAVAVFGAGGLVRLRRALPTVAASASGRVRIGLLPWVAPLLEAEQARVPWVLVLADRTGADLHGYGVLGGEVERTVQQSGTNQDVEKVKAGGWSQRRFQERAVNTWQDNAEEVAVEVAALADHLGAKLVALGGDEQAVGLLADALPARWSPHVRRLEHATRADGSDATAVQDELDRVVASVAGGELQGVLAEWEEERGQGDRAASGPARVVEALQQHTVQALLVADDPDDARTAWFGPEPGHVGTDRQTLEVMGVAHPQEARLGDVCVRAALGTGADVWVVAPELVEDGLGAVLRHTGTSPDAGGI